MHQRTLNIFGRSDELLFSAQDITQDISLVQNGTITRTVNGEIVFLGQPSFQKYITTVKGKSTYSPALEKLWRGREVIVQSIQFLTQEVGHTQEVALSRLPNFNSIKVYNQQKTVPFKIKDNQTLVFERPLEKKFYVCYCPILTMVVVNIKMTTQERQGTIEWGICMEEV